MNFALLQTLLRLYSNSFNSSNVGGKVFLSWILKDSIEVQENKKKVVVLCSQPPKNRRKKKHVKRTTFVPWRQKNVQKSLMLVQSCCFFLIKPVAFLPFSLPSPSSLLIKLSNVKLFCLLLKDIFSRYSSGPEEVLILLTGILTYNKSVLCRSASLAFSLVVVVFLVYSFTFTEPIIGIQLTKFGARIVS